MAIWFKRKISLLTIGFICLAVAVAVVLHALFGKIEAGRSAAIATLISSLLRDESSMSRSYILAQSIEDMQAVGIIRCARLSRMGGKSPTIFYDSTFKGDCDLAEKNAVNVTGLDGHDWKFEVVPSIEATFYILKWLTIFGGMTLVAIGYLALSRLLAQEHRRRESTEKRRAFLEELTQQVGHDVASPISALKMIAARAPLDNETKVFFNDALKRTEGIFASLKGVNYSVEKINIREEINRVVDEKGSAGRQFPKTNVALGDRSIPLPKLEFGRMISNLLDNAQDAGADSIQFTERITKGSHAIVIRDNGRPIPNEVRDRLGARGNTIGKSGGSGLGLYHACQLMKALGGELKVASGDDKIILVFPI